MRRPTVFLGLLILTASVLFAVTVGSGSPTMLIQQSFVNAYDRGQFSILANTTPLNDVHGLGSPGLVQEFSLKTNNNIKLALVKPDPTAQPSQFDTLQVLSDIYASYTSIGVGTAGYPTIDTTVCPTNSFGACTYQFFTKNYALFAYSAPFAVNYAVRDPFFTPWMNGGGVAGSFGPVTSVETSVTSYSKVQGLEQTFATGAIFAYPAGATAPTVHTLVEPVNSAFSGAGGYAALGFPTAEPVTDSGTGLLHQAFENGRIEVTRDGTATVLYPIRQIDITYANLGLNLALNSTAVVNATELDTRGFPVTGRVLNWSSSNGAVVAVTGTGESATLKATGAGSANIIATGEGKTSPPLQVIVRGVCCGLGDGAPPSVSQAFQNALTRNRITVVLPAASQALRIGGGYIQSLTSQDGTAYVVSQADNSQTAWVMSGGIYAVYVANGGFGGALGYPVSDTLAGNIQKFAGGALIAGAMPRVIPSIIATKWLQTGLGDPLGDASAFTSFSGKTGASQSFANGTIFGLNAGGAYLSSGPILARYAGLGGPAGALGVPTGDGFANGTVLIQNFETGYIDLQPRASAAIEHFNPRHPSVSITPATVVPGGRVHIAAAGFAPGSAVNFSITGQTGFAVQPASGAFEWDVLIPVTAKSAVVAVQAKAAAGSDVASASYSITTARELLATLTLVSGDQQTAFPGGTLASPLIAIVKDGSGNPVQGLPVTWSASPGVIVQGPFISDAAGMVMLRVRLPLHAGVVVGSLSAAGQVVAFSALAAAGVLPGARAISSDALGQYLAVHHGFYTSDSGASVANPWIAAAAQGASVTPEATSDTDHVRDLLSAGSPVVLVLNPGAAVVANGVDANGMVTLLNSPVDLNAYSVAAVFRQAASAPGNSFTVESASAAAAAVNSPVGSCPQVDLQGVRFQYCDGTQPAYELDLGSPKGAVVVNLALNSSQTVAPNAGLSFVVGQTPISAQPLSIAGVLDSAAFDKRLSPGGLFTIFGSGLATGTPVVNVGGKAAKVLAAFPFQLNVQMPADAVSGNLQVTDLLGSVSVPVTVSASSPGIFVLGTLGAILNQDSTLNTPDNPALRGQFISVYCTGLGSGAGTQVLLNGVALQPTYAGVVVGFPGLYQVNVQVPGGAAPGSAGALQLRAGGVASNVVPVALQ